MLLYCTLLACQRARATARTWCVGRASHALPLLLVTDGGRRATGLAADAMHPRITAPACVSSDLHATHRHPGARSSAATGHQAPRARRQRAHAWHGCRRTHAGCVTGGGRTSHRRLPQPVGDWGGRLWQGLQGDAGPPARRNQGALAQGLSQGGAITCCVEREGPLQLVVAVCSDASAGAHDLQRSARWRDTPTHPATHPHTHLPPKRPLRR
jgi:hypothetical protein